MAGSSAPEAVEAIPNAAPVPAVDTAAVTPAPPAAPDAACPVAAASSVRAGVSAAGAWPGVTLPDRWPWLIRGFRRYVRWYLAKHFHAVRLDRGGAPWPLPTDEPLLVVLNHPSWWDPLIGVFLSGLAADYEHFAAIDAAALQRYRFFARLGFFGVTPRNYRGAATFLRYGLTILSQPRRALWVTAQGRFADVRQRPVRLEAGVGHLAARLRRGWVVPLAVEYPFWTERTPEALVRVGSPLAVAERAGQGPRQWLAEVETALTRTMDELAASAQTQDEQRFVTLLTGRAGIGGWYDRWQRLRQWLRGQRYDPAHAAVMRNRSE